VLREEGSGVGLFNGVAAVVDRPLTSIVVEEHLEVSEEEVGEL